MQTTENTEKIARRGVAALNKSGKISVELKKNDVGNFDFFIWETDGEHARSFLNIELSKVFDLLDVITATIKGIR